MTALIIIVVAVFIVDMYLSSLRPKLIDQLIDTKHNKEITKMTLPNLFWNNKKRGLSYSPIKYVFTRKHKELNNKSLSRLSDLILLLYLISWVLWFALILQGAVVYT